jgi:hypothetical protein
MSLQAVLLPPFVEVILTFALGWPPRTMQAAIAYSNRFELPVLFHVLTILEWVTRHAGYVFGILAWIFVICRVQRLMCTSPAMSCGCVACSSRLGRWSS